MIIVSFPTRLRLMLSGATIWLSGIQLWTLGRAETTPVYRAPSGGLAGC